jgi:multidrug efflux system membrane fusion protein
MDRRGSLLVLLLLAPIGGCQGSNGAPVKPPPPNVEYQLPVPGHVTDYADFPGTTDAIVTVQVRSRVSGYMTKVYFKDGTMVEEGNLLFEIDPRQYKAEHERAEGNLQQIEAHARRLKKEYERARNLLMKANVSQEEFDRYESDFKETQANLEIAKANRDLAALNLDWTEVRAPSAGLLSRRQVDPGNLIRADDTVLTSIVTQDPMYVYFDVDEQNMLKVRHLIHDGKIKARSEKEVPVMFGLSDESSTFPHSGTVDFTDNRVDTNTGSLRFRAAVRNEKGILTPGLFVRVRLPIGEPHTTLFVREEALASDQGRKIVYTVEEKPVIEDGKPVIDEKTKEPRTGWVVVVKPLKIGALRDGFRAVEEGLSPTDKVIVTGLQRVRPGKEVKPTEKPLTQQAPKDLSFHFPEKRPDKPADRTPNRLTRNATPTAGGGQLRPSPGAVAR